MKLMQRVTILRGMAEFVGKSGRIIDIEAGRPPMYRVRLDEPVEIAGLGPVTDDLWEGQYLRAERNRR